MRARIGLLRLDARLPDAGGGVPAARGELLMQQPKTAREKSAGPVPLARGLIVPDLRCIGRRDRWVQRLVRPPRDHAILKCGHRPPVSNLQIQRVFGLRAAQQGERYRTGHECRGASHFLISVVILHQASKHLRPCSLAYPPRGQRSALSATRDSNRHTMYCALQYNVDSTLAVKFPVPLIAQALRRVTLLSCAVSV